MVRAGPASAPIAARAGRMPTTRGRTACTAAIAAALAVAVVSSSRATIARAAARSEKAGGRQSSCVTSGAGTPSTISGSPALITCTPPSITGRPPSASAPPASRIASRAAAALDPASSTPASRSVRAWASKPCGSAAVPQIEATNAIGRSAAARASRTAAATAPAGSGWAPWPSTTSSSTTPTVGSAAACTIRAARAAGSIIGCGRPAVYWSSPRSITSAGSPARPSSTLASPASVPPVYSPSTRPAGPVAAGRLGGGRRQRDPDQPGGLDRGPLQGAAHGDRFVGVVHAEQAGHDRGAVRGDLAEAAEQPLGDRRCRRLRDDDDHLGRPVRREQVEGELGHHPAHRRREVAAADPDQRGVPDPGPVEQAGHLLRPGARGRHDADRAGPQHVREAERHPVEHRGAAVRSHHQQPALRGQRLEPHLVLDRDVVGEAHDVQPAPQRLLGDDRRVRPGHRHGGHRRPGSAGDALDDRLRALLGHLRRSRVGARQRGRGEGQRVLARRPDPRP